MLFCCLGKPISGQHIYPINQDSGCTYIDSVGTIITTFHGGRCSSLDENGYATVWNLNGVDIVNRAAQKITLPFPIDSVQPFFSNLYLLYSRSKFHFVEIKHSKATVVYSADSLLNFQLGSKTFIQLFDQGHSYLIDLQGSSYLKQNSYNNISPLENSDVVVYKNEKKGISDLDGREFLPPTSDSLVHYENGYLFYQNGKVGYKRVLNEVDPRTRKHKIVFLPPIYESIKQFGKHYLRLEQGDNIRLFDIYKQEIIVFELNPKAQPFTKDHHVQQLQGKYALLDLRGNVLTGFEYFRLFDSQHKDVVIYIKNKKYGFLSGAGEELTGPDFDLISPFEKVNFAPRSFTKYKTNEQFGLINKKGEILSEPKYINIKLINTDRAACVNVDSSARVLIIDESNYALKDHYDIVDIKQLNVQKSYLRSNISDVHAETLPTENGYALGLKSYVEDSEESYRYNNKDYFSIEQYKLNRKRQFILGVLNTTTVDPFDQRYSMLSIEEFREIGNKPQPILGTKSDYNEIELIDSQYYKAETTDGNIEFWDTNLQRLKFKLPNQNGIKNTFTAVDYYPIIGPFDHLFKIKDRDGMKYVVMEYNNKPFEMEAIYDSLYIMDTLLFGQRNLAWKSVSKNTPEPPPHTVEISSKYGTMISKHQFHSYDIYSSHGQFKHRYYNFEVIEQDEGITLIQTDSGFNYLNSEADFLLPKHVEDAKSFHNGYASFLTDSGWVCINKKGEIKNRKSYKKPLAYNIRGVSPFYTQNRYGLVDTMGTLIDSARYLNIKKIRNTEHYVYSLPEIRLLGIISEQGKILTEPLYSKVYKVEGDLLACQSEKGILIYDAKNHIPVSKPKFDKISAIGNGFVQAQAGNKSGIVSPNGEWIVPVKPQKISKFNSSGFASIKGKKGYHYLLTDGEITTTKPARQKRKKNPIAKPILPFYVDTLGYRGLKHPLIEPKYHSISILDNGAVIAQRDYRYTVTDISSNQEIIYSDDWINASNAGPNVIRIASTQGVGYYNTVLQQWVFNPKKNGNYK